MTHRNGDSPTCRRSCVAPTELPAIIDSLNASVEHSATGAASSHSRSGSVVDKTPMSSSMARPVLEDEGLLFSILEYCPEESRRDCLVLNRRICSLLTSPDSFQWRLHRLHVEFGIYYPPAGPFVEDWKSLYLELYESRYLWMQKRHKPKTATTPRSSGNGIAMNTNKQGNNNNFHENKIFVCARFKPQAANAAHAITTITSERKENDDDNNNKNHKTKVEEHDPSRFYNKKIVLPLHQRLSLIRMGHNLTSNRQALRVLQDQGDWFGSHPTNHQKDDNNNVIHKDDAHEIAALGRGVHSIDSNNNRVIMVDPTKGLREFSFDRVLPDPCSQQVAYDQSGAKRLVTEFINGSNATCLAYGQTGSGKTYTMFGRSGSRATHSSGPSSGQQEQWGIVPRACQEVFEAIQYRQIHVPNIQAGLSLSMVEIFGDSVSDLLQRRARVGHSKIAAQRYVLNGAAETPVQTFEDLMHCLQRGEQEKRVAATAMNEYSSRAHTLLILTLRQYHVVTKKRITSKLFLADLGGSEQIKKSLAGGARGGAIAGGAVAAQQRQRAQEAIGINLGLLALKKVATALNANHSYIPYADSKLTMLLSAGLGGNSKTLAILCAAQDPNHTPETMSTIFFGQSVGQISNTMRRDEETMLKNLIEDINRDIAACEEKIRQTERWETTKQQRVDEYGQVEMKTTTALVGAETQRLELEGLLQTRAKLTGSVLSSSC